MRKLVQLVMVRIRVAARVVPDWTGWCRLWIWRIQVQRSCNSNKKNTGEEIDVSIEGKDVQTTQKTQSYLHFIR